MPSQQPRSSRISHRDANSYGLSTLARYGWNADGIFWLMSHSIAVCVAVQQKKTALRHNSDVLGWDAIATSDEISAWRDGPDHGAARFWLVESTARLDRSRCALRVAPRDARPVDLNMSLKCNICIQISDVRTCSIVRYPS